MKKLLPILGALVLWMSTIMPVGAYTTLNSSFNNSSIGDGVLGVCFENNTPVYTNRSIIMSGIQQWTQAIHLQFVSNGRCDGDGSNIHVRWDNHSGGCGGPGEVNGWVDPMPQLYSSVAIHFNSDCAQFGSDFMHDWGGSLPVSDTKADAYTLATHEAGHALGIGHSEECNAQGCWGTTTTQNVMDWDAGNGTRWLMSQDDANAIRFKYPGLGSTGLSFPTNSPVYQ